MVSHTQLSFADTCSEAFEGVHVRRVHGLSFGVSIFVLDLIDLLTIDNSFVFSLGGFGGIMT